MRYTVMFLALFILVGFTTAETTSDDPDNEAVGTRGERNGEGNDGDSEDGDTFLDPYYEAEKDTSGCFLSGCFELVDFPGLLTGIDVSYNPDPFRHDGVRSIFGETGNPLAFSMDIGLSKVGENKGYTAQAMLLTPTPLGVEALLHRVSPGEGEPDFSLVYLGIPVQFAYGSPLQLMLEPQLVFPREDHRWTLTGGGIGLLTEFLFLDGGGLSADYRLTWINGLPMHRGEARLSWYSVPMRLWAGYTMLRNCRGETLQGPCAGLGLIL